MNSAFKNLLIAETVALYDHSSKFARHFAHGKLSYDPMFAALLNLGLIPDGKRLLDLGCGQGILAAWLLTARQLFEKGLWSAEYPPPALETITGIDLMPRDIQRAQQALTGRAEFITADVRTAEFGTADVIMLLDVLHYLNFTEQQALLTKIRASLSDQGVFITRIGDRAAGLPCLYSQWVDLIASFIRGHRLPRLYCRSVQEWQHLLSRLGFQVESYEMSKGTLFANFLLVARLV